MWKKICDRHTLLKYAKNVAISEICGNRIKMTCLSVGPETVGSHTLTTVVVPSTE